ncbi:MAG: Ig-like domain repeat protein, partial [Candidatus Hodarchaeota archaeon]
MKQKIYSQIVLLTVLVGFFVVGKQNITIGRGADYVTTTDLTLDPDSIFLSETVLLLAYIWSPQIMLIPQGNVLFEDITHGLFQTTAHLNESGYATFSWTVPSSYPTGTITIHACYTGNDWFEPSEDYAQLSIDIGLYPTTTELTLNPTSVFPGETVTLTAEVQSSVTIMIPQGDVLFEDKTNSKNLGTVSLDATGRSILQWNVPNNQKPKTLNIRATYLGDPDGVFAPSKDANSLLIEHFSSVTSLTLSSAEVWDEAASIEISIQVSGIGTSRIPSGTVTLHDQTNDYEIDTLTLDTSGFISKTWKIPNSYSSGDIGLIAAYKGNSWFYPSKDSSYITIKHDGTPPAIWVNV